MCPPCTFGTYHCFTYLQNERLGEENRVRIKEETHQARLREKRKEEAKNNIILQVTKTCHYR